MSAAIAVGLQPRLWPPKNADRILMEGADMYQIAKNCRTSVEMIEKFHAAHIKNTLDAAAINVRRSRPAPGTASHEQQEEESAEAD